MKQTEAAALWLKTARSSSTFLAVRILLRSTAGAIAAGGPTLLPSPCGTHSAMAPARPRELCRDLSPSRPSASPD
eukprot:scaffold7377_cov389-Prasinococcus_capsulatus_cf.AAC.8